MKSAGSKYKVRSGRNLSTFQLRALRRVFTPLLCPSADRQVYYYRDATKYFILIESSTSEMEMGLYSTVGCAAGAGLESGLYEVLAKRDLTKMDAGHWTLGGS